MYNWLKKNVDPVIPLYGIIPLLSCFALNMLVYSGSMTLCADWYHHDLTTALDRMVPVVPEWMLIYFGCYLFWIVNYIMTARIYRDDRKRFYQFVMTDMMSRMICAVFYIAFPTTNVRPIVAGEGIWEKLLLFLYKVDQPANLFPSIHCLVSWLCFAGIRESAQVSKWYKAFSCIFALLVVISTQVTKQHYIADAIAGLFLAEFLFRLNKKCRAYVLVERFFNWFHGTLYGLLSKGERCEQ